MLETIIVLCDGLMHMEKENQKKNIVLERRYFQLVLAQPFIGQMY